MQSRSLAVCSSERFLRRHFPFYFCLDAEFRFSAVAETLEKAVPEAKVGTCFHSVFSTESPLKPRDSNELGGEVCTVCLNTRHQPSLEFRGYLEVLEDGFLFLTTLVPTGDLLMQSVPLSLSDFPAHSLAGDLIVATRNQLLLARQSSYLLMENSQLRLLLDDCGIGMAIVDEQGRLRALNRPLRKILHLSSCNMEGSQLELLDDYLTTLVIPDEKCERLLCRMMHQLESMGSPLPELESRSKDVQLLRLIDGNALKIEVQSLQSGGFALFFRSFGK